MFLTRFINALTPRLGGAAVWAVDAYVCDLGTLVFAVWQGGMAREASSLVVEYLSSGGGEDQ